MNFVNSNPPMPTAVKAKGRILPNFMDLSFCLILSSFLNNIPPSKKKNNILLCFLKGSASYNIFMSNKVMPNLLDIRVNA